MRIGIITMYHNSCNCGGCLQAYALCKAISRMGHQAEQIRFSIPGVRIEEKPNVQPKKDNKLFALAKKVCYKVLHYTEIKRRKEVSEKTHKAFEDWKQKYVSHSDLVYTKDTIGASVKEYDAFITGSDQVWNLKWYNPTRFLDFVPSDTLKIAYAASVCMDKFTQKQKEIVKDHLKDFNAISVREQETVGLIEEVSDVAVQCTLDPTLLLSRHDWDSIASEKLVDTPYIFCYFLGEDDRQRKIAKTFAKQRKLKIATIAGVEGRLSKYDKNFGDIKFKYATPSDFISLIKHAQYVFTDSFHASVFSGLYQKEVFAFQRNGAKNMANRLYSLSKLFDFQDHFCDEEDKVCVDYINGLNRIDYSSQGVLLNQGIKESLDFLKNSL